MRRDFILGAFYGDHLPSGAFCATVPRQGIATHLGWIALPPGETFGIGYPRCTDVGAFRFAGQAHDTLNPACWEYAGSWRSYPPPCVGVSPVIYDRLGVLHRSDGSVGSQGYRYVTESNQIVSGDQTYGPFYGLFEYTDVGGLWIGQAAYDGGGVQVWDGSTLRQLETGDCRFVRANRDGETVALAFTKPDGVVLIMTTMAELRALPPVGLSPQPSPAPQPVPTPEPSPMPVPNQLATVQRIRAKYPTPLGALHGRFLVEVAQAVGGFLFRKDDGILIPALRVRVSQDIVIVPDHYFDVLVNGEADAIASWQDKGIAGDAEKWIDVSGVSLGSPSPGPQPIPSPQPVPQPTPAPVPTGGPSFHQWMDVELPQLVAAYTQTQGHPPDCSWGAFITYRRFLEPGAWPFDKMLAHERGEG